MADTIIVTDKGTMRFDLYDSRMDNTKWRKWKKDNQQEK